MIYLLTFGHRSTSLAERVTFGDASGNVEVHSARQKTKGKRFLSTIRAN